MTLSLFIDPGVDRLAGALFGDMVLVHVGFFSACDLLSYRGLGLVVIEKPRVYPKLDSKDKNDLIDLAIAAGRAEMALSAHSPTPVEYVFPADWKGQLKKPISHLRIWEVLSPNERLTFARCAGLEVAFIDLKIREACARLATRREVTGYGWSAHNLFDAVGIGLWRLGRVGRACTRPHSGSYPQ